MSCSNSDTSPQDLSIMTLSTFVHVELFFKFFEKMIMSYSSNYMFSSWKLNWVFLWAAILQQKNMCVKDKKKLTCINLCSFKNGLFWKLLTCTDQLNLWMAEKLSMRIWNWTANMRMIGDGTMIVISNTGWDIYFLTFPLGF